MLRNIIEIDEDKCDGCGLCIPACAEGAIQLIDDKARLVKDVYCDGLGACLGHCPQGAIKVIQREADVYDEHAVMQNVIKQGPAVIKQHLEHLKEHGQFELLAQAEKILASHHEQAVSLKMVDDHTYDGCPGSQSMTLPPSATAARSGTPIPSALTHWPIQMHLISPQAEHYRNSALLLAADCVAYSMGNFHQTLLPGKTLAVACPKLDNRQEIYLAKLVSLIDQAKISSLHVLIMQVPCCSGLAQLAQTAIRNAHRKIPLKTIVISLQGDILEETEISEK